jgi:hypothetical protein
MTLNWGHKVTIGFTLFAGMIIYLVYQSMHTRYDLVSKDYYKEELQYQQIIESTNRANRLSSQPAFRQTNNTITLQLPYEMTNTAVTGNLWFYSADNAAKDKKIVLQVNEAGAQNISSNELIPGNYTAKINWQANNQTYYSELPVTVQ